MMRRTFGFVPALFCGAAFLVSCGGGAGGSGGFHAPLLPIPITSPTPTPLPSGVTPTPLPTPTPTPSPTPVPAASAAVPVSGAASAQSLPVFAGFGGTINLPSSIVAPNTSLALSSSTYLPANLPLITAAARRPLGTSLGNTAIFFVCATPSAQIVLSGLPGFTFTLPSIAANVGLGLAFYDPTTTTAAWQYALYGAPNINGLTVTFANAGPATLVAGKTYCWSLFAALTPSPTPSPSPTASPTPPATPSPSPTPSPTPTATPTPNPIVLNPASVTVSVAGAPHTQSFTVTEASYTGTLSAVSANTGLATVSPASGTGPGPLTFTVTAVAVGRTTIFVYDGNSVQNTVSVTVNP